MATNVPPHNLREVVEAALALIRDPGLPQEELEELVRGPGLPDGGLDLRPGRDPGRLPHGARAHRHACAHGDRGDAPGG